MSLVMFKSDACGWKSESRGVSFPNSGFETSCR